MSETDMLTARFTISTAAKKEIENIRRFWNITYDDPADTVMIGWGLVNPKVGSPHGGVVVSFYGLSQRVEIEHGIQRVSGLPVVFFTTKEHAPRFDGKVVDFASDRGFFTRAP